MKTHVVLLTALLSACSFKSETSNSQASSAGNSSESLKSIDFGSLNSFKLVHKINFGGEKPATVDLACTNSTDARVFYIVSNKQGSKIMANAQTIEESRRQLSAAEEGHAYMQISAGKGNSIFIGGGDLVKAYNSSSTILNGEARFSLDERVDESTYKSVRGTCKGLFSFEDGYLARIDEIVFTKSKKSGVTTFDIIYHQIGKNCWGCDFSETTTLLALNAICASGNFDVVSGKTGSIDCREAKPQSGTLTLNVIKADLKENGKYTAQLTQDIFGPLPEGLGVGPVEPRILGDFFDLVILK
jgi:hypothetical protein